MPSVIEAVGLRKTFTNHRSLREILVRPFEKAQQTRALRGVDLSVEEGEIFGLLGPNGAGKTTLIKILSCLVIPDAGEARIQGRPTTDENQVKRQIGLVHSDERSFYWRLSARQNLRFFAQLYDVPRSRVESRISELLETVNLTDAADRPFSGYSSGMKQRVAIARAMLHDPPILLMDEPTRSLDPASARSLRQFIINDLRKHSQKTILLATHNLREAEVLADRVAVMVKGRARKIGTVDDVRRWGVQERRFRLAVDNNGQALSGPFRIIEDHPGRASRRITVAPEQGAGLNEVLQSLVRAGVTIHRCDSADADLEDAFTRILEADDEDAE